jgi:hypothetical protein
MWARHHQVAKFACLMTMQGIKRSGKHTHCELIADTACRWPCYGIRFLNEGHLLLCRTGICLPLVCKAFRGALLDVRHVRLWGTVTPLRCIPQHLMPTSPDRWTGLEKWLEERGPAMRTLQIK